jgi:ankyrin repeat protein
MIALTLLLGALCGAAQWARRPEPAWGALHRAARDGDAEALEGLLAEGGDVNAVDPTGATPLHAAAMSGDLDTIDLLLASGACCDAVDREGDTPLLNAIQLGHEDAALLLLERGADARLRDKLGRSALHMAALLNEVGLIVPLIARGADPQVLDGGLTALNVASAQNHPEFVRELIRIGAARQRPQPREVCLATRHTWF